MLGNSQARGNGIQDSVLYHLGGTNQRQFRERERQKSAMVALLMTAIGILAFTLVTVPALAAGPAAATKTTPATEAIAVGLDDGRLTLTAPGATLEEVLRAIAAEADFKLAIKGDLDRPLYATRLEGVPLAQALHRLVGNTSMVMRFAPARDGSQVRRVAELRLYATTRRAALAPRDEAPSPKSRRGRAIRDRRAN